MNTYKLYKLLSNILNDGYSVSGDVYNETDMTVKNMLVNDGWIYAGNEYNEYTGELFFVILPEKF